MEVLSQDILQAYLNTSRESIVILDKDFKIISFNKVLGDNIKTIFGITVKVGDNFLNYAEEGTKESFINDFNKALKGDTINVEIDIPCENFNQWWSTTFAPLYDRDGNIFGVSFLARDTTDKHLVEEKLNEYIGQFKNITQNLPNEALFNYQKSETGYRYVYISEGISDITGYSMEDFMSNEISLAEISVDESVGIIGKSEAISEKTSEIINEVFQIKTKEGRLKWVHLNSKPIFTPEGNINWYGMLRDVTISKESQISLLKQENRFRSLQKVAQAGIFEFNPTTGLFSSDAIFSKILGVKNNVLNDIGSILDIVEENFKRKIISVLNLGNQLRNKFYDFKIQRVDNNAEVWLRMYVDYVKENDMPKYIGSIQDITESKNKEIRLRESEELYSALFHSLPISIFLYEKDTLKLFDINQAAIDKYGFDKKKLNSKFWLLDNNKDFNDHTRFVENLRFNNEYTNRNIERHISKEGQKFYVDVIRQEVKTPHGTAILSIANDISYLIEREQMNILHAKEVSELKLEALRAAINPHFIFNTLNSIQYFILKNEADEANLYLSKFSKLIRGILTNAKMGSSKLAETIKMLDHYIGLEQIRFEQPFEYILEVDDRIDIDFIEIPTLIIQPFVENAILHGLYPMKEKGKLKLSFQLVKNRLEVVIEDNGIGRKAALIKKNREPHLSFGMSITMQRISVLKSQKEIEVKVFDLYKDNHAAGTIVKLIIDI